LAAHPAYRRSLDFLRAQGVTMVDVGTAIEWSAVTDALTRTCG
jgi:hypothetical protein